MPQKCINIDCTKIPSFNLPNKTETLYCFEHKKENMIDIKSKRCINIDCTKIPSFNLPNETNALYCSKHKKENMIDIKHKKCINEGCQKRPTFNLSSETNALYTHDFIKFTTIKDTTIKDTTTNSATDSNNLFDIPNFDNIINDRSFTYIPRLWFNFDKCVDSGLHYDKQDSILYVLTGRKKVLLSHPQFLQYIYLDGIQSLPLTTY